MPNMVIYDKSFTLSIKEDLFVFRKIRKGNVLCREFGTCKNIAITTKSHMQEKQKL